MHNSKQNELFLHFAGYPGAGFVDEHVDWHFPALLSGKGRDSHVCGLIVERDTGASRGNLGQIGKCARRT